MSLVYWDTMLFIYWLEENGRYVERIRTILDGMEARGDVLCTSAFTLGEVLTGPYKRNELELARRIGDAMCDPYVRMLPYTTDVADRLRFHSRAAPGLTRQCDSSGFGGTCQGGSVPNK